MSPGFVEAMMTRASKASGFWVGWTFLPSSPFSRSPPEPEGVAKDEYLDRSPALFTEADADQDGMISPTEFTAIVESYGVLLPK